mmetsp:Transcript_80908/g.229060  ORF Transcript_80908/g.229060 Transcript_80908/m.229060 type:complete len:232 (+) Transcript_80908:4146-4841(+)
MVRFASALEYRDFASVSFALRKVFARSTAVWALPAATSDSLTASMASLCGSTSTPLRKGSSASVVAARASSAFSTLSCACWSTRLAERSSRCFLRTAFTSSTFSRACRARSLTDSSSFLKASPQLLARPSAACTASATLDSTGPKSSSVDRTSSSVIWPSATEEVRMWAFSTSSSAALSLPEISSTAFLAAARCSTSLLNFLSGFSFLVASVTLPCRLWYSCIATLLASGA